MNDKLGSPPVRNGETKSHKTKIMKLLYFAQGHYLTMFGRPLFFDAMKAYEHGPAIPDLVDNWDATTDAPELPENLRPFVDTVISFYGSFTARQLSALSHETHPWKSAREGCRTNDVGAVIPLDGILQYFEELESMPEALHLTELSTWEQPHFSSKWRGGPHAEVTTKFLESSLELSAQQTKDFHQAGPDPLTCVRLLAQTLDILEQIDESDPKPFFPE